MKGSKSVRLVIDASVARAAGGGGAVHPKSKTCRDFLISVLEVCHRAIMSREILDEWKEHQSRFATGWRTRMRRKGKLLLNGVPEDENLRKQIEKAAPGEGELAGMMKDLHLIEAALASDRRIVSLDEKARNHFRDASKSVSKIKKVLWVNPERDDERPLEWLRERAKDSEGRRLGYQPEP